MLGVSRVQFLTGLPVVLMLYACATPNPGTFAVPRIETSVAVDTTVAVVTASATDATDDTEAAATFEVRFDPSGGETTPGGPSLRSMRMIIEAGRGTERGVVLLGDELTLAGTAETILGDDRWLVGVSGVSDATESCIVVRMAAERDGDALRGWAVVDADGSATSLSFVAEPTT